MKNYCLILLLVACSIANAQKKLPPTKELYIGVSNWIYDKVFISTDSITTSVGVPEKKDTLYRLKLPVTTAGQRCVVKGWKNGKIASTKNYKIKHMPLPRAVLAPSDWSYSQRVENIVKSLGIVGILGNFNYLVSIETVSYKLTYKPKNGKKQTVENKGSAFSPSAKSLIAKAKPGDRYVFTTILAKQKGSDGAEKDPQIMRLKDITVKIIE